MRLRMVLLMYCLGEDRVGSRTWGGRNPGTRAIRVEGNCGYVSRGTFTPTNRRRYNFTINGVTDVNRNSFENSIGKYLDDVPIFLYEPNGGNHSPLNDYTVVPVWATANWSTSEWKDLNELQLSVIEDLTQMVALTDKHFIAQITTTQKTSPYAQRTIFCGTQHAAANALYSGSPEIIGILRDISGFGEILGQVITDQSRGAKR